MLYQPPLPSPDLELDWATEVEPPEVSDQVPARGSESALDQVSDQVNHEGLPMYDPDLVEMPYHLLVRMIRPKEPWGAITEFFPPGVG